MFVVFFFDDYVGVILWEVVLVLERVDGKDEGVDGECNDVDDYLFNVLLLFFKNED